MGLLFCFVADSLRQLFLAWLCGSGVGVAVGGEDGGLRRAGISPTLALAHTVALGKAYLLFWVSVSPSIKWGVKGVRLRKNFYPLSQF